MKNKLESSFSRRDFISACTSAGVSLAFGKFAFALEGENCSSDLHKEERARVTSPWLSGNYAPIFDEITSLDLRVDGTIPPSLKGVFIRNGPNPIHPPQPYHWFDGDGMLHAMHLDSGTASYSNRFIQTKGYQEEKAAQKVLYGGLLAGGPFKNAANISIVQHHQKVLATWEGGLPHEINPATLSTEGMYSFNGQWRQSFTAHPKIDPVSGEMIFFGYSASKAPFLSYGVLDAKGRKTNSTTIDIPEPVMMHDFGVTENYTVFLHLPLVFGSSLKFSPEKGARIGVLPRNGSGADIHWFPIDPCWVFHVINAFEEGDTITLRAQKQTFQMREKLPRKYTRI